MYLYLLCDIPAFFMHLQSRVSNSPQMKLQHLSAKYWSTYYKSNNKTNQYCIATNKQKPWWNKSLAGNIFDFNPSFSFFHIFLKFCQSQKCKQMSYILIFYFPFQLLLFGYHVLNKSTEA